MRRRKCYWTHRKRKAKSRTNTPAMIPAELLQRLIATHVGAMRLCLQCTQGVEGEDLDTILLSLDFEPLAELCGVKGHGPELFLFTMNIVDTYTQIKDEDLAKVVLKRIEKIKDPTLVDPPMDPEKEEAIRRALSSK